MSESITFAEIEELKLLLREKGIHKGVKKLIDFYEFVTKSPYYDSYVALRIMMANLNDDLKDGRITLFAGISLSEEGGAASVDEKTFMNAHKYATETKDYHEQLKYLRANMTPDQMAEAEKKVESSLTLARKGLRNQIQSEKS